MDTHDSGKAVGPPHVVGRLLNGTFWLALQIPLQLVLSMWSLRLIVEAIGPERAGAYRFAVGLGFCQLLLDVGAGSALQRQISTAWAHNDRVGVNRAIASGMIMYAVMTLVQMAALSAFAILALPHAGFGGLSRRLVVRPLCLQAVTAPFFGVAMLLSCVLQAAHRYDFVPRYEVAITVLRFLVLVVGVYGGIDFFWVVVVQTAV